MSFGKKKKPTGMTGGKNRPKRKIWTLEQADTAFSIWIRERDNHTCRRCGKYYAKRDYEKRERGLTNSHFWPRQHKGTRFDPKNCDAVCWMPCHKYYWEKEKQGDYRDFKIDQLGLVGYAEMEERARDNCPQDRAIIACMAIIRPVDNP